MLNIKKILLPVDFPNTSFRVIHQAATLAHQYRSEIVMLHVVTALSQAAGLPTDGGKHGGWDLVAEIIREAQKNLDHSLGPALEGLLIKRSLVKGETTEAILETAQQEKADLIMMPSYGYTFDQFLVGSVTPRMLHVIDCPVWTDGRVEKPSAQEFTIRNVLCAVDFKPHSHKSLSWAVEIAAEFGARLTIAHVTAGVEFWGPGGSYVNPEWKAALVGDASEHIAELQRDLGIHANIYIGSGDVPKVLHHAVEQTKADLLVTGCQPYGGYLRTHGNAIICAMPIPVVSVRADIPARP
jgi:nucleotide-binding universal stress UspA family protein